MKIAFDIDDVLVDFFPEILKFHNDKYGSNNNVDNMNSYNLWETWGGSRDEAIQKVLNFYESSHFKNLKPFDEAVEVVEELSKNHDLIIVTSRPFYLRNITNKWVEKYFPKKFSKIILIHHYPGDDNNWIKKDEVCVQEGVDAIIEDSLNWAQKCSKKGIKAILLNRPWNQDKTTGNNILRIEQLKEVLDILG